MINNEGSKKNSSPKFNISKKHKTNITKYNKYKKHTGLRCTHRIEAANVATLSRAELPAPRQRVGTADRSVSTHVRNGEKRKWKN
jgi:hypothetical protein